MNRMILIASIAVLFSADQEIKNYDMKPNQLIHSTSPYLLQHAYNPVDWHQWGEAALAKAKREDKPILVSIGYSSCHWCHVMEKESFENEEIARLMNENFICIKVDREERPDIDQIYMEAVQAMGINGGWPLNVFLTPDQKPFYGGTYFPPANWTKLLAYINELYRENRNTVSSNADQLAAHLVKSDLSAFRNDPEKVGFEKEQLEGLHQRLTKNFDEAWGGHDRAPKFIMPSQWRFLLAYYRQSHNQQALEQTLFTLDKIMQGGIYDQVGGGFARYSVDAKWFVPHFEKMLYDNAQLLSLYSEAYKITGDEKYKTVLEETIEWLKREMTHEAGGFYSALDADSEGEEGKFYVWTKPELEKLIDKRYAWIYDYYSITDSGNWEHGNNILFVKTAGEEFIREHQLTTDEFKGGLRQVKAALLAARGSRVRPGLDDKVVAGWNAMTIIGLIDAYTATGFEEWLNMAERNIEFIETHLIDDHRLFRSWNGKHSSHEGFLDDYAYLIAAYIKLYQITFDETFLHKARHWFDYTETHFFDEQESFYFYSSARAEQLIARKKEVLDNVIPSSNAVMARNAYHLGILFDNAAYRSRGLTMTKSMAKITLKEPGYASSWAGNYAEMAMTLAEVVIVGKDALQINRELQRNFLPYALWMGTTTESNLPLIQEKTSAAYPATIYVCFNKTCKLPVHTSAGALQQISQARK